MTAVDITPYSSAREMLRAMEVGDISARELLDLHLDRIDQVNPGVNALVNLDPDRARLRAAEVDQARANGVPVGALAGLPIAFKDTHEVEGWVTSHGSVLRATHVSDHDDLVIARLRAAGVVPLGRSNVPEFAVGGHTSNALHGTTHNPYHLQRSAGGSSGGAAAALATGMIPIADGSDTGGSLRIPSSYCNVVGLRPSLGRVPTWPTLNAWETLSVSGPMGRTVADVAVLLSTMAGAACGVPQSLHTPAGLFDGRLSSDLEGLRVAVTSEVGAGMAIDADIVTVVESVATVASAGGALLEHAAPDLSGALEVFSVLRAWHFHEKFGPMVAANAESLGNSLVQNAAQGARLTGADVSRALVERTRLLSAVLQFFERYDVLLMPVTQAVPFPVHLDYPEWAGGVPVRHYLDWVAPCTAITAIGCPALSLPAGFTADGLPIGVQLVAAPGHDRLLLDVAHALEERLECASRRPPV